jgi:alkaline phosphatase D
MSSRMSRRDLLAAGGVGAFALASGSLFSGRAIALPRGAYPFVAGVASGEPAANSVVLWTRIALDALGRTPVKGKVPVSWELAEDEGITRIVARGVETAIAKEGHSVHVEVPNLKAGHEYHYRFYANGEASAVGRTRTAPKRGKSPNSLRFCLASCSNYEAGYFTAYKRIADDDPWFVVHVGDYIYEGGPGTGGVRQHSNAEPMEIAGYRERHAQYNSDPDLLELRRLFPIVVTPDDHEVENNYANLISQVDTEPDQDPKVFAKRRAAAYQAYYEFMPLRDASHPQGSGMQLYRELPMGDLLNFVVADTRQYRTDQPYNDQGPASGPDMTTPAATLPGIAQEQWIVDRMSASKSTWNVLAQQVLMASHDLVPGAPKGYSTDQWDAYRASRQRVLSGIHSRGTPNPVVLTGDIHQHYASDLLLDFDDPSSPIVGSELCGTSVTSGGDGNDSHEVLTENPWIKYNGKRRGYVRVTLDANELRADFRVLPAVTTPNAPASTGAGFTLQNGRPGLLA